MAGPAGAGDEESLLKVEDFSLGAAAAPSLRETERGLPGCSAERARCAAAARTSSSLPGVCENRAKEKILGDHRHYKSVRGCSL